MRLHRFLLASLLAVPLSLTFPFALSGQTNPPAAGNIATFAGNAYFRTAAIIEGVPVAATDAALQAPDGLAMDSAGNLYIADKSDNLVRMVDHATGYITTVAGTAGTPGFAGDGGAATSAQLKEPISVAVNGAGTILYIADYGNNRIRKVDLVTRFISTFAGDGTVPANVLPADSIGDGGSPTAASIDPHSVAIDPRNGDVYIADQVHRVIRKVDAAGAIITTVAGVKNTKGYLSTSEGGLATTMLLDSPKALAFDLNGNLYIADQYGERIFKVDTSNNITTFAGTGASATSATAANGDGGAAKSAQLWDPAGVATDTAGNVYITDQSNFRVRKVDATINHTITTVAGNGVESPAGGNGTAAPGDGGLATEAQLNHYAAGIVVNPTNSNLLYIADFGNTVVRVVNLAAAPTTQVTLTSDVTGVTFTVTGNSSTCERYTAPTTPALTWTANARCSVMVNIPTGYTYSGWLDATTAANPRVFTAPTAATTYTAHLIVTPPVCSYSLSTYNAGLAAAAGDGNVNIITPNGCPWSASSSTSWLTVTAGTQGTASGPVAFHVEANNTISPRTGTLTIGGQTLRVAQSGSACSYTLSATSAGFTAAAGDGSVNIATLNGCGWTAASNAPWLTLTAGTPGTASGPVAFHAEANNTVSSRTGTLTIGGQTLTVTQAGTSVPPSAGLRFVPVTPCRVADTRNADGPLLSGQTTRDFAIPQSTCGIPANAQAYSVNFTVVPVDKLTYITVFPTGQPQPLASTLNSFDGRVKANAAIVPAGTNGAVSVFATDNTQLIIDINGYFVPASTDAALAFYPLAPCRLVDTRGNAGPLGAPALSAQQERVFPVLTSTCQVPSAAKAYSLNYTVVPKEPLSYLTTFPTGQTRPVVSTLNAPTGTITANAAIVPAGDNGDLSVYVTNSAELIIDINGYFAPPTSGGLSLYNLAPCRVYDSRSQAGAQPIVDNMAVDVAGSSCNAPASVHAQSYIFNTTVIPTDSLLFLTLWPHGTGEQPNASALNAPDGKVTSNMAIVPTTDGSVSAFASQSTHLILDIFGYFAP